MRTRRRAFTLATLLACTLLAGCLDSDVTGPPVNEADDGEPEPDLGPQPDDAKAPLREPWPDGATETNYTMTPAERLSVASHDGTLLEGWLIRPAELDDVLLPSVLIITPYGSYPDFTDINNIPTEHMVANGYAVVWFDVRGTGGSGGCIDHHGRLEAQDSAHLARWVVDQPWSNGRLATMGLSYLANTALQAATYAPEAVTTTILSGVSPDWFTFSHTPQAATSAYAGQFFLQGAAFDTFYSVIDDGPDVPPDDPSCLGRWDEAAILASDPFVIDRAADYWNERDLRPDLDQVTAAVLLAHGFLDHWGGEMFQEDDLWSLLPHAPKWQLEGQWAHTFPGGSDEYPEFPAKMDDWNDILVDWLDFWLKDEGPIPAGLGFVDYQDDALGWHRDVAWPPSSATLHQNALAAGAFLAVDASGVSFDDIVCGAAAPLGHLAQVYTAQASDVVTGNPSVDVRIRTASPAGIVAAWLARVPEGGGCQDGVWDADVLTAGAADLRYINDRYFAEPFPVDQWVDVHIDLANIAITLEPGDQLAILLTGGAGWRTGLPLTPQVDVHGDSTASISLVPPGSGERTWEAT